MLGKHFLGMRSRYRLEDRRAVPCSDITEWNVWFASADRRVAETWIGDLRAETAPPMKTGRHCAPSLFFLEGSHDPSGP